MKKSPVMCSNKGCKRQARVAGRCSRCYQRDYHAAGRARAQRAVELTEAGLMQPLPRGVSEERVHPPREIRFVTLPAPYVTRHAPDEVLDVILETLEEDLTLVERDACSHLPIGQDPIYWLVRRHFRDEMTLEHIGRMYGVSRERIRQIESSALFRAQVVKGLAAEAAGDHRDGRQRTTHNKKVQYRTVQQESLIEDGLEEGLSIDEIAERVGVPPALVKRIRTRLRRAA